MRLVVFSGGSGAASVAPHLVAGKDDVTFLVNAYDDGRSTGAIRSAFSILGPSDMGKLVSTLSQEPHPGVAAALAGRSAPGTTADEFRTYARRALINPTVPARIGRELLSFTDVFLDLCSALPGAPPLGDLALRNAVLVGARALHGESFQAALDALRELLDLPARIVVASEEVWQLACRLTDGQLLLREWEICERSLRAPVEHTFFYREGDPPKAGSSVGHPGSEASWPALAQAAEQELSCAEAIIWSSGTLYSSLVPTANIAGPYLASIGAVRTVLVANLRQEQEAITVHATARAISRGATRWAADQSMSLIDVVICDDKQRHGGGYGWGDVMPADHKALAELCDVYYQSLEQSPGRHDGEGLAAAIRFALDN